MIMMEVMKMKIQEICDSCHITKKAIYYYEKQHLIKTHKNQNGYREFSEKDVQRIQEIVMYRSFDISIEDIRYLLDLDEDSKKRRLTKIYQQRQKQMTYMQENLKQMYNYIENNQQEYTGCITDIYQVMKDSIPQPFFEMFYEHFESYLHVTIQTSKQQEAYLRILDFWNHFEIKIPFFYRILFFLSKTNTQQLKQGWHDVNLYKNQLLEQEDVSDKMKQLCLQNYQLQQKWWYRILSYPQRKMKIRLRNSGYYDILLPAMCDLSQDYAYYYQRLIDLNQRVCQELNLYYDAKFRLRKK